jgi:hypothetical protein
MVINVRKIVILAVILLLILQLAGIHIFYSSAFLPEQEFVDPSYDLVDIYTCVPSEVYVGYLDVIRCSVEWTVEAFDFYVTINGGIPALTYTTFWNVLIDADNNPENNCPDAPYKNVDTMYSLVYDSSKSEWRIESATYETWGWSQKFTDATWGITSSWPEGQPVITISIPIYEMPEMLPETLPWKVLTECTGTYIGDFAPNCEERYETPLVTEFISIEGVFQPVQVVYQQDPRWGDNMTRRSSHEWVANLPMVQGKNTLLFGYPYDDRYMIRFNVTNKYTVQKIFNLTFWVEGKRIHETGPFTVAPLSTVKINLTAPLPRNDSTPTPFKFESKGDSPIEVEVHPIPGSEPIQCNKVIVHTNVTRTQGLSILYVPILLFNGTTGNRLHDPVTYEEAEEHARRATEFVKGTYPVAENQIDYQIADYFAINHTEVRTTGLKVNLALIGAKLTNYAWMEYPGYTRIVGLVPDNASGGRSNWAATYSNGWNGVMIPNNREVVWVVAGRWATTAHEIGHTFGLWIDFPEDSEEYNRREPGYQAPGYWVNKLDDRDRATCFMGRNPYKDYDAEERWVCKPDYQWLVRNFTREDPEVLLVNGLISKNGDVQLFNWYHLSLGVPDIPLNTSGDFNLLFLDNKGSTIGQAGFNIAFVDKADEPEEVNVTNFAFKVQYVRGTVKIKIVYKGLVVAEREVTKNSPIISVTFPNGNEILNPKTPVTITWNASDADGDPLTYILEYSNNSGLTWTRITVDVRTLSYNWNISGLLPGRSYMVKVLATDGVNVGEDVSDNTFTITFQGDLNEDESVNIHDMFVVAKAFGSSPGHPLWNPKADVDGNGIINIYDLFVVAKNYGKTI